MDENLFLEKVSEILSEDIKKINFKTNLFSLKNWDSMTILELIVFFENELKLEILGEDLAKCETINDLYNLTKIRK